MKKITLLIIVLAVAAGGFLQAQEGAGYYNRNNEYDNYAYADYEFRHSNAAYHIDRYGGDIYYFHHYRANVYFVLVGPNVFVVPGLTFRNYLHRPNIHWLSRADFIAISAVNFPYYDSYVRFGYYSDYYDHNPWSLGNHLLVTRNYRTYYRDRSRSKRYYRHLNSISAHQSRAMERVRNFRNNRQTRNTYGRSGQTYQRSQRNASQRNSSASIRRNGGNNRSTARSSGSYRSFSRSSRSTGRSSGSYRSSGRSSGSYRSSGRRGNNSGTSRSNYKTSRVTVKKRRR